MTDSAAITADRREAIRALVKYLTRRAKDPERIGVRVLMLEYALRRRCGFPEKANSFARYQKLSPARVSEALTLIDAVLDDLETRNFTQNEIEPHRLAS